MPAPLVTVALPVRNAATTIKIAVASILKQTFGDWELIVVDDGSTDQTLEIVSKMHDARLRLVHEPPGHLGLAARLNQCIELARGAYFARMDGDDISYPRRLERQIRYLEQNPDIDLLGTGAVVFRGGGNCSAGIQRQEPMRRSVDVPGGDFPLRIRLGWGGGSGL